MSIMGRIVFPNILTPTSAAIADTYQSQKQQDDTGRLWNLACLYALAAARGYRAVVFDAAAQDAVTGESSFEVDDTPTGTEI